MSCPSIQRRDLTPLVAAILFALALLQTTAAAAGILAHPVYEPDDPSAFASSANLFLKAKVMASPHWSNCVPQRAVDGARESAGAHWAAESIPVWLTVDMQQQREINAVRLWTYWGDGRYYQYVIEGSADGKEWKTLVDMRKNEKPADAAGETFSFPAARARYVRTTFTHNSRSNKAGGHIVEIEGYALSQKHVEAERERLAAWAEVGPGLHGAFGSKDVRYPRSDVPAPLGDKSWAGVAWRGERLSTQLLLWTAGGARQVRVRATELAGKNGRAIVASCVQARFVRYVLADGRLMPDVLDDAERLDLPARSARPVWVSVNVPADAQPGVYDGRLAVSAEGGLSREFDVKVEVLPAVLPPPAEWSFHLDLWQNPFASARYHRVRPWSDQHLAVMEPHLRMLAEAGQKCITTTIVHQPWGTQTHDPYDSMVKWIRRRDGSWRFDYDAFDCCVELCQRCGITRQINCYSMVPWTNRFQYFDEASGDYKVIQAAPGTKEYEEHWRPFLKDFAGHLRQRGWLEKAAIAMDERPENLMRPMIRLVHSTAKELKIALAGRYMPSLKFDIHDWCVFINPALPPEVARERAARGMPSTFYVCCGPDRPNTFTFSPPAESAWLGWYAAAQGYSGFLRWAHDSWVDDPLYDTSFVTWPAGDCFLVYPGARSSIRFERLREGIQEYEKVRIVREALGKRGDAKSAEALKSLDAALSVFSYKRVREEGAAGAVNNARKALIDASRAM